MARAATQEETGVAAEIEMAPEDLAEAGPPISLSLSLSIYVYMYVCIYVYMYYIYIYIERERERHIHLSLSLYIYIYIYIIYIYNIATWHRFRTRILDSDSLSRIYGGPLISRISHLKRKRPRSYYEHWRRRTFIICTVSVAVVVNIKVAIVLHASLSRPFHTVFSISITL